MYPNVHGRVSLRGLYHKIHVFEFNIADSNCFVYLEKAYDRVLWVDYYKASDPCKTKVRAVFRSLAHFQGMFSLSVICKA